MDTRDQLLESAERLARTRGYDAFSYADLAADVGIRKASIHHHFPRKADLGLALIKRYRDDFAAVLGAMTVPSATGMDLIWGYLSAYRDALNGGETLCLCVAFSAGRESLSDPILRELNGFHADGLAWLKAAFERATADGSIADVSDPEMESAATLALVEGAQLMARASGDVADFDRATAALRGRLQT
ncbi:MAG: TetR/AcrR family transcriptional regulator [Pseudomonadota bacterium]